jgi:hypothetical protein
VDWANYTLTLQGMIRTTNMEGDKWRYRVEVGWTQGPYPQLAGRRQLERRRLGYDYYERTNPGGFLSYSTPLMAESDYVTVYLRVWKKWGRAQRRDRHQLRRGVAHRAKPVPLSAAGASDCAAAGNARPSRAADLSGSDLPG